MARLAAGIKKRADGTLEKRFTMNGRRYSVYGRTSNEVLAKEQETRAKIKAGTYTSNSKVTLDEYYKEFIKEKELKLKGSTLRLYDSMYKTQISPRLGSRKVNNIERREIINFRNDLRAAGLGTSTCNAVMTLLKSILGRAVIDEVIVKNPAERIDGLRRTEIKATETIHRALTVEEQAAFMAEAKTEYHYEFMAMLLLTGMRTGECAALTWGDIDYKNHEIHITKSITKTKTGEITVGTPKTKTSTRDIPMTESVETILKAQREKMCCVIPNASSRIFSTPYAHTVVGWDIGKTINKVLTRLEEKGIYIEHFSAHAFRDTFATRAIEQGMNPQTLKTILGHSSLAMTMDLYAHVMPNTKHEEMNLLHIAL
mgnify:CR=1 FL=1